jgi:hypothetical protein
LNDPERKGNSLDMTFAPTYSDSECRLVGSLLVLGLDLERTHAPRREFRAELRDRLVAEARTALPLAG